MNTIRRLVGLTSSLVLCLVATSAWHPTPASAQEPAPYAWSLDENDAAQMTVTVASSQNDVVATGWTFEALVGGGVIDGASRAAIMAMSLGITYRRAGSATVSLEAGFGRWIPEWFAIDFEGLPPAHYAALSMSAPLVGQREHEDGAFVVGGGIAIARVVGGPNAPFESDPGATAAFSFSLEHLRPMIPGTGFVARARVLVAPVGDGGWYSFATLGLGAEMNL